jgi:trigger factor
MTVLLETLGPCRRKLKIDVPAERVTEQMNEVVGQYRKMARIPGFRPGKAPAALVQNHFRKEIMQDVAERLVPSAYREAVQEQKLAVLLVVDAEQPEIKPNQPYQFSITVDVRPEFTLPEYKGIPVKIDTTEITEADIDKGVEDTRRSQGRFADLAEGSVEAGDLAQLDFAGIVEGEPAVNTEEAEIASLLKGEGFWSRTDEQSFMPELTSQVVGMPKGETKEIAVTLPAEYHVPVLAGRLLRYNVRVSAIRRLNLPELNEEFFKKAGVADLAGLRERVAAQLRKNKELSETYSRKNGVQEWLLQNTTMDLPESAVQHETRRLAEDFMRRRMGEGMEENVLREHAGQIFEGAGQQAQHSLKVRFILAAIAEKETIEPSESDIKDELNRLANQLKMDAKTVEARLRENNNYDKLLEDIRNNKTVDFLVSQANFTS